MPNRATTVETSLASHIVTIPSLFSPPPPSTTTTTTRRRRRRQAPRLTPTFGPTRGELINIHATQDRHVTAYNPPPSLPPPPPHLDCHHRHVTAPVDPQHHPNHHHVTRITATSPDDNDRPPSRVTAAILTAMSSPANDDDDDDNLDPQCHVTADRTSEGATEEEWERIEAGAGDTSRGGEAGERRRRSSSFPRAH